MFSWRARGRAWRGALIIAFAVAMVCAGCADPVRPWLNDKRMARATAPDDAPAPALEFAAAEEATWSTPAEAPAVEPAVETEPASYRGPTERAHGDARLAPPDSVRPGVLLVNGETITVESILDPIKEDLQRRARTDSPRRYAEYAQQIVANQIWQQVSEVLLYQEAREQLDERFDAVLEKEADRVLRERVNAEFGGRQARFERHLCELELSLAEVRQRTARRLLVSQYLRQKLSSGVTEPRRDELVAYYERHIDEFRTPARSELLLIDLPFEAFLSTSDASPDSPELLHAKEQARRQALAALSELHSGIPFAAVAETYSRGVRAGKGGAWGAVSPESLVGRYRAAGTVLFTLDAHTHSRLVEGEDAFFIVGAGAVQRAQEPSFEAAQPRIREAIRRERLAALEREYLAELRDCARVDRWREFTEEVIRALPKPTAADARPRQPAD